MNESVSVFQNKKEADSKLKLGLNLSSANLGEIPLKDPPYTLSYARQK